MLKRVIIHTGYCGEDADFMQEFPDDITENKLNEWLWDMACEHAQSYGHEVYDEDGEVILWNLEASIKE